MKVRLIKRHLSFGGDPMWLTQQFHAASGMWLMVDGTLFFDEDKAREAFDCVVSQKAEPAETVLAEVEL